MYRSNSGSQGYRVFDISRSPPAKATEYHFGLNVLGYITEYLRGLNVLGYITEYLATEYHFVLFAPEYLCFLNYLLPVRVPFVLNFFGGNYGVLLLELCGYRGCVAGFFVGYHAERHGETIGQPEFSGWRRRW